MFTPWMQDQASRGVYWLGERDMGGGSFWQYNEKMMQLLSCLSMSLHTKFLRLFIFFKILVALGLLSSESLVMRKFCKANRWDIVGMGFMHSMLKVSVCINAGITWERRIMFETDVAASIHHKRCYNKEKMSTWSL